MTPEASLDNLVVVSFESRMSQEMERLVQNFRGSVVSAPSMQEIPFEKNQEAFVFAEKLLEGRIDMTVFLTGIGVRSLMAVLETRHPRAALAEALSRTVVVARGPKPVKALREYGVSPAVAVPEPNTWREILREIDENEASVALEGKTVAVQEYGESNAELIAGLEKRKAHVFRVPVYRWALPDDLGPLKAGIRTILDGRAHVALFTNKVQVDHIFEVARQEGWDESLRKAFRGVVVASIGPICTEGLMSHGISVDLEARHGKIGSFVLETAQSARGLFSKKTAGGAVRTDTALPSGPDRGFDAKALAASPFMKACRLEPAEVTPVWLMRQAGRYMKEYREIRRKVSFKDFCRDAELAAQVTVAAQEYLNADAAIIFSDILLLLEAFGMDLEYAADEGPVLENAIGEGKKATDLREVDVRESFVFLFDAIRRARRSLKKNIPLLGFAGAPFTLVSYMVEGGGSKNFRKTKSLMYREPDIWRALMDKVSGTLVEYLRAQTEAGVQALQLFDSWAGCLGPDDYREFVKPYTARVLASIPKEIPVVHFGTGNPALLRDMAAAGGSVIGVDWRVGLAEAWKAIGPSKAIQGNLDPLVLCSDLKTIERRARAVLDEAAGKPGHIFNLGHGVLPETPPENARFLVEVVHRLSRTGK